MNNPFKDFSQQIERSNAKYNKNKYGVKGKDIADTTISIKDMIRYMLEKKTKKSYVIILGFEVFDFQCNMNIYLVLGKTLVNGLKFYTKVR